MMLDQMKAMARPYATLFAIALIVAVLARVGLAVMDATGALAYDYISASGVPMLDVVCSILTGSALVAFLFDAALALTLSTAGVALYAALCRREGAAPHAASAFAWGWATAIVSLVCLMMVASGILSGVQVGSMSSKLPGAATLVLGALAFSAFLGTLLGAAAMVAAACVKGASDESSACRRLAIAALCCGIPVMLLTVGTFSALNAAAPDVTSLGMWLAADLACNLVILFGAPRVLIRKAKVA